MSKRKMSPEELKAESLKSEELIRRGSVAELQGAERHLNQRFSLQQMSSAVKRHHREAARMWNQGRSQDDLQEI